MSYFRFLLTILILPFVGFLLYFLNYKFIFPNLNLPKDICYYHNVKPPIWIKYLYLDTSDHINPTFNVTYFLISILISSFIAIKFNNWLLKKTKKS
jgi:hypothetical protein